MDARDGEQRSRARGTVERDMDGGLNTQKVGVFLQKIDA
jgi:hypothetical protein